LLVATVVDLLSSEDGDGLTVDRFISVIDEDDRDAGDDITVPPRPSVPPELSSPVWTTTHSSKDRRLCRPTPGTRTVIHPFPHRWTVPTLPSRGPHAIRTALPNQSSTGTLLRRGSGESLCFARLLEKLDDFSDFSGGCKGCSPAEKVEAAGLRGFGADAGEARATAASVPSQDDDSEDTRRDRWLPWL
jgi:hypothetical protein